MEISSIIPTLDWIRSTTISQWVNSGPWIWPTLETLHFTGLGVLIGGLIVMDLRLIGYKRGLPLRTVHKILPLVFIGGPCAIESRDHRLRSTVSLFVPRSLLVGTTTHKQESSEAPRCVYSRTQLGGEGLEAGRRGGLELAAQQ